MPQLVVVTCARDIPLTLMTPARLALAVEEAERVFVTQRHDLFAAAVLAEVQLRALEPLGGGVFPSAALRLAWISVQNTLREAQRAARAKPAFARGLDEYAARIEMHERLSAAVEGDPVAHVRHHEQRVRGLDSNLPGVLAVVFGVLCMALLALVSFGGLVALAAAGGAMATGAAAMHVARLHQTRRQGRREARRELFAAMARAEAYARHMEDPEGGLWLVSIWQSHPLLLRDAPTPAIPASGVFRVQVRPGSAAA